ncbi:MAG: peptidylprolyl isomerase [Marinicaulis sp.]|nr:peptidylprolyl isomerase [Marinicaulis sp.]
MRNLISIAAFALGACSQDAPAADEPAGATDSTDEAAASPANATPTPGEILANAAPSEWRTIEPENTLYFELASGRVVIELSPQLAPNHVAQVKALAREGFYDGLSFYRVIEGFVAQGGDPFEAREIKSAKESLQAEFDEPMRDDIRFTPIKDADGYASGQVGYIDTIPSAVSADGETVWHLHCTGAFAFGRNNERDSASTEFYITMQPQRYLDRNLSVFGRVIAGMEHIHALRRVAPPESEDDDIGETIISVKVAADVPAEDRSDYQVLDSASPSFARYVESRRNRPSEFFYFRPDYVDVCQLPMPIREKSAE